MRWVIRRYSSNIREEIYAHSTVKISKRNRYDPLEKNDKQIERNYVNKESSIAAESEYRENEVKIQMLSRNLFTQIFGCCKTEASNAETVQKCLSELQKHGIKIGDSARMEDVIFKIPKLKGKNIEEHFTSIAADQVGPYKSLIDQILCDLPPIPEKWSCEPGMTCYYENGPKLVEYPEDDALIFDIEVCMSAGKTPTIACAAGKKHWYSWTSSQLANPNDNSKENQSFTLENLISLGMRKPKLVVGHNVSFDRARIREQYLLEDTGVRFLDTMSLHVCVSGVTSYQRAMLKSKKGLNEEDLEWSTKSSLNSLQEVYQLYCQNELKKEPREIFVSGSLEDVRQHFHHLMTYCAGDVIATHAVFRNVYPMFQERFPHPATLAGMLEIGSAYLPVNSNWNRYIEECNLAYEDLDVESRYHLAKKADEACQLLTDKMYKKNLWMWDQDWSTQTLKLKKSVTKRKKSTSEETCNVKTSDEKADVNAFEDKFHNLIQTKDLLPVRRPMLAGYPAWYRKLCLKSQEKNWSPGAVNIGTGMQITPKLLSLCWEGYPLHYLKEHGWGFLVPFRTTRSRDIDSKIPLEALVKKCPVLETDVEASYEESSEALNTLWKDVESNISKKDYYRKAKKDKTAGKYTGTGVWCNVILEDCCWFVKLPHKNGPSYRVGNPLAKDFLNKFSDNVLSGDGGAAAERVIEIARMLSYWRNNRDRITNQLVVWLPKTSLPKSLHSWNKQYGAIIPQIVVCGTLTRRAMEPLWLTASNTQRERIGSELRAMVQTPKGYKFVGADVDSQELWIASILGDACATKIHGGTPFGWMTLIGNKSNGTDMHSVTAKAVGISREHAKVINYARIYGAGQNFAQTLLKQFNPTISDGESRSKAMKMFTLTKGKKSYYLLPEYQEDYPNRGYSSYEALKIAAVQGKSVREVFERGRWEGGTESAMFNRLEDIAECETPVTPFLNGRLSRALEPRKETNDRFLPTRVNWVVQSGAVDFLHLMLVCMRWLMGTHIRFCLSFHDEVRYMVKDELAYKTALAMHVTNMLTRSFCAYRVGLADLPMSVAFFSSVDIDTCLRKDGTIDCKTPSNPHGLEGGYGITKGESLDIYQTIAKVESKDMSKWTWHVRKPKKIST